MPENAQITFQAGSIPEGVCPSTEQQRFNLFVTFLSGFLPGTYSTRNVGTTEPVVDDRDKLWDKLSADGSLVRSYAFSNGVWNAPYTFPAGPNALRLLWAGALADLDTFDGGSAGAVTAFSGPFWESDVTFDDKVPRGATATVPVNTDAMELTSGASATDQVRGVYFIKRTLRGFFVA